MSSFSRRRAFGSLAACATPWLGVRAQDAYPNKAIKFVVPSLPGSTSDLSARAVAQKISARFGRPVVIDNRPGAAGQIGMQQVATSPSDGYTFVVVSASTTVVPPAVIRSLPYSVIKDFAPVSLIANTRLVLVVASSSPYKSVSELVAAAKAAPGRLSYGDSATLYLLSMERFKQLAGIDLLGVKYKGPSEAATDLLGGRITMNPDSLGSVTSQLHAGQVRPLAIFSRDRAPGLPDVPTMIELGYRDFVFDGWIGVLAPTGTPDAIVQRVAGEIETAVGSDDVRRQYAGWMLDPVTMTPNQFTAMIASETARFESIAREAQIEKQ